MIVTIHQPAYLPWLGYFEKIIRSDVYVYMDTVQFERESYINRNKIKTANGCPWLTVPVLSKNHIGNTISNLIINNKIKWQRKHFMSISESYRRAPYYNEIIIKIKPFYETVYEAISEFCYDYLLVWLNILKIETKVIKLSEINVSGIKSDLVLEICKYFEADTYLSGAFGKNYLDEKKFCEEGINIVYQDYRPRKYPQLWGEFVPALSVLDFVMNTKDYSLIKGA